jgi:hypothetical protein
MATKANKKKFGGCSGAKCSAVGNAYKAVDGPCRKGIAAGLLKDLISEAAKNGADEAAKKCGQGCVCGGRFRVTVMGTSPIQFCDLEQCVWYVAGVHEGICVSPDLIGLDKPAGLGEDIASIVKRHEHGAGGQPRPAGSCDQRSCCALGNSLVTVGASPEDGIDADLMTALIDAAAAVAQEDADAKCPKGCGCTGEFHVSDSGVERVRIERKTRYIWWIGGYWQGKCEEPD